MKKSYSANEFNYVPRYSTHTQPQNIDYTISRFRLIKHALLALKYHAHVNRTIVNDSIDKVLSDAASALILIQDTYRFNLVYFSNGHFRSNTNFKHMEVSGIYKFSFDKLCLEDMFYLSHIAFESTLYDLALKFLNSTISMYSKSKCLSSGNKEYCIQYNFWPTMKYYIEVHNQVLEKNHQWLCESGRVYPHMVDAGNIVTKKLYKQSLKINTPVFCIWIISFACVNDL